MTRRCGRELNTIGSKSTHRRDRHRDRGGQGDLEKVREQVKNSSSGGIEIEARCDREPPPPPRAPTTPRRAGQPAGPRASS